MNINTVFPTIIPEFFLSHWGQLCGRQRKLRIEKCCSVCLVVMVMHSLNCHLSDRFFSTPSISHSLPAFYSLCIAARKLQKVSLRGHPCYISETSAAVLWHVIYCCYSSINSHHAHFSIFDCLLWPWFLELFTKFFFFSFTTEFRILILAFIG